MTTELEWCGNPDHDDPCDACDDLRARVMSERWTCPTLCDSDCEDGCHEIHAVTYKREHDPNTCPGAVQLLIDSLADERATVERVRALCEARIALRDNGPYISAWSIVLAVLDGATEQEALAVLHQRDTSPYCRNPAHEHNLAHGPACREEQT